MTRRQMYKELGKGIDSSGNRKCKRPEAEQSLLCSRNSDADLEKHTLSTGKNMFHPSIIQSLSLA